MNHRHLLLKREKKSEKQKYLKILKRNMTEIMSQNNSSLFLSGADMNQSLRIVVIAVGLFLSCQSQKAILVSVPLFLSASVLVVKDTNILKPARGKIELSLKKSRSFVILCSSPCIIFISLDLDFIALFCGYFEFFRKKQFFQKEGKGREDYLFLTWVS